MKRMDLRAIVPLRPLLLTVVLAGILLFTTGPAAVGQESLPTVAAGRLLTLEESVAMALERNFGIRQQRRSPSPRWRT